MLCGKQKDERSGNGRQEAIMNWRFRWAKQNKIIMVDFLKGSLTKKWTTYSLQTRIQYFNFKQMKQIIYKLVSLYKTYTIAVNVKQEQTRNENYVYTPTSCFSSFFFYLKIIFGRLDLFVILKFTNLEQGYTFLILDFSDTRNCYRKSCLIFHYITAYITTSKQLSKK